MKSTAETINARHDISIEYCKLKGWDFKNLTIEQTVEIRETKKWRNANI